MTEQTWLTSGDSGQLLTFIRKHPHLRGSNRRLALFAAQSVLRVWGDDPAFCTRAMEIVGRVVDSQPVSAAELDELTRDARPVRLVGGGSFLSWAIALAGHRWRWPIEESAKQLASRVAQQLGRGEMAAQCRILRDIFGNPFRPVAFSPDWRTDTAVSLARTMYESREFSAMPILADALQDAGCDEPAILAHCRDTSLAHVRGCWVTDLVLGKA